MKTPFIIGLMIMLSSGFQLAYASSSESAPPATAESETPKIYLKLDPALVVNVEEEDVTRFLQVDAQLQFGDQLAQPIIEKHMPAIRHAIIMVLSGSSVKEIKTAHGKEVLREATLKELQKVMTETTGEPVIDAVYFTGFVIQ